MKKIIIFLFGILVLSGCANKYKKMQDNAKDNLVASLDYPQQLKITAISKPDSAFGVTYFTDKEIQGMMRVMGVVTRQLMEKTRNIDDFDNMDAYTSQLLRRQMNAISELRSMMLNKAKKGAWSGWKVKIDYSCKDKNAIPYNAERWVFLDKDGESVVKTFEIPLP